MSQSPKEIIRNIIYIIFVLLIFQFLVNLIGIDNLQQKINNLGIFGPIIFIFLKSAAIVFAPLSGTPLYLIAGSLFGVSKGILFLIIGDFIGFTISFYISRIFGKKVAIYFLSKTGMKVVKDVLNHIGTTKGLIQSCIAFIGFSEVVSYAAGLTNLSYLKAISTIVLIELIPLVIIVKIGEATISSSGESSLSLLNIIIIVIAIIGIFWLYLQSKKNSQNS